MDNTSLPAKISLPFANAGAKTTIPVPSQIGVTPGAASYTDGFPPLTRTPLAAGGVPPFGQDMNGILYAVTAILQWQSAGGLFKYDSALSTSIGGYPAGAQLLAADGLGIWINTADNNTANPDTVGTNWVPGEVYGTSVIAGLTNANITLTPAQAMKQRITLAGTLTGNINIIVPTWLYNWVFVNNTSGAFTVTVKTASGTGIVVPQNGTPILITGDGTNITQPAQNIALGTSPTHAAQISQVSGIVGQSRNVKMVVAAASASATLTADEVIVETALAGVRYCLASLSKTINLSTTGAGGMDTGTAPVSGYVALYLIYNPSTGVSALLAKNATASVQTEVYSGANMPSGFTASALLGVYPTNASSQFIQGFLMDRETNFTPITVLSAGAATGFTSISLAAAVPPNGREISGNMTVNPGVASNGAFIAGDNLVQGSGMATVVGPVAGQQTAASYRIAIPTAQTAYYVNTAGSSTTSITVSKYKV